MNSGPYKIVVADDDCDDQFFLVEAFKKSGEEHQIEAVSNGAQLMELLLKEGAYKDKEYKPDLILLDLNMPVMDGFTALSRIKKNKQLKDIPVFILTTSRRENDKTTCNLLGADDFFSKPSEIKMLHGLVKDILFKVASKGARA